jgi:hypothetical protein
MYTCEGTVASSPVGSLILGIPYYQVHSTVAVEARSSFGHLT